MALAATSAACVGSEPDTSALTPDAAVIGDGSSSGGSGGTDAGVDGGAPAGRCVFGASRFGDGCKLGS